MYLHILYLTLPADLEVEVLCLDLWLREVEDGVGGPVNIHQARGWGRGQRGEWLSHYQVGNWIPHSGRIRFLTTVQTNGTLSTF